MVLYFLLDPSDPLFVKLGEAFIKQQIKEYGDVTDIYNCDTFNENSPPTDDPTYISSLGAAVYEAMAKGDKYAVWLMQVLPFLSFSPYPRDGSFIQILNFGSHLKWKYVLDFCQYELCCSSSFGPKGKMVVLDLFAEVKPIWETSSQFYGTPYVWCMLHNFGGNIEMYGVLDSVASGPVNARTSENSTMVGVGMCMEGIEHNPVVYELMSEMAFRNEKVELVEWIKTYSCRRYGKAIPQLETAWEILYHTIYNCTDGIADHNKDYIVEFPDWDPVNNITLSITREHQKQDLFSLRRSMRHFLLNSELSLPKPHLWYPTEEAVTALYLFLDAGKDLVGSLTYRYDLVDLTRQALSKLANNVYLKAVTAFQRKDLKALNFHRKKFIQLIKDIDEVLASDDNFLLGTWLESAKSLASDLEEKKQKQIKASSMIMVNSSVYQISFPFWKN
ncbi:Alpha-N-acetylglucosaminidase [Bienertia sinuspersici]